MKVSITTDNSGWTFDRRMSPYWYHDLSPDIQRRHTISQGEDVVHTRLTLGQHKDTVCTISQRNQLQIELDLRSRLGNTGQLQQQPENKASAGERDRALQQNPSRVSYYDRC